EGDSSWPQKPGILGRDAPEVESNPAVASYRSYVDIRDDIEGGRRGQVAVGIRNLNCVGPLSNVIGDRDCEMRLCKVSNRRILTIDRCCDFFAEVRSDHFDVGLLLAKPDQLRRDAVDKWIGRWCNR